MKDFDAVLAKVERSKPVNILFRRGDWVQYAVIRSGALGVPGPAPVKPQMPI